MSKKVLVLCQRKSGPNDFGADVSDTAVPYIETYVETYFGPEFTIEYLTKNNYPDKKPEQQDYDFDLGRDLEKTQEFIDANRNSYSLIIMNTCPFRIMIDKRENSIFDMAYDLLVPHGLLTFKIFGNPDPDEYTIDEKSDSAILIMRSVEKYMSTPGAQERWEHLDSPDRFMFVKRLITPQEAGYRQSFLNRGRKTRKMRKTRK